MTRMPFHDTDYPAVRRVMGRERERLSDGALEALLERAFPDAAPLEVEDFMGSLQRFARRVAPVVQQIAPAVAQGAMTGATVGGPWGALIGGLGGGAKRLVSGPGGSAQRTTAPAPAMAASPIPQSAPPPTGTAPVTTPLAPLPPAAPAAAGGPAASAAASAQLLAMLSRPETMQALLALVMGPAGRGTIPVGDHRVPTTEFANAISELAAEAASADGGAQRYWFDASGEPRCDVADPRARAALVWRDMAEAMELGDDAEDAEGAEDAPDAEDAEDAFEDDYADVGDPVDSFEAALMGGRYDDDA